MQKKSKYQKIRSFAHKVLFILFFLFPVVFCVTTIKRDMINLRALAFRTLSNAKTVLINASLLNYVPRMHIRHTYLCTLPAFAPYTPSWLTRSCLACLTYAPYLCASHTFFFYAYYTPYLCTLRALFVHLKIFYGWIYSPSKSFNFLRAIKNTTNPAVFTSVKKQSWNFLNYGTLKNV